MTATIAWLAGPLPSTSWVKNVIIDVMRRKALTGTDGARESRRLSGLGFEHKYFTQLGYHLDESTFRFDRRTSTNRGPLFHRLLQ